MNAQELNTIADEVHQLAKEKGWHSDAESDIQYISRSLINIHGELSELWEAARKNELARPCDKACHLTCEEEEMADVVIRVLDYCGRRGIDIGRAVATKHEYNGTRSYRHGGKAA